MSQEELILEIESLLTERKALLDDRMDAGDRERLLHDLSEHQVELETQNRNLRDAQAALEESRARYAHLYSFAPIALFALDERARILDCNARAAAKLRLAREQLLGRPLDVVAKLDPAATFLGLVHTCFADRERVEGEISVTVQGGAVIWAHVTLEPILDEVGRAVSSMMALTDVTRLKALEVEASNALAAERSLRHRLVAVSRAHAAVSDAMIEGPADARRALQVLVDEARALVGAEYAAIGLDGTSDASFDPWVYSGITNDTADTIGRPPRPVGVLDLGRKTTKPIRLRDLKEHSAFRGFPPAHPPMSSFLGTPIRRLDRIIGMLYVTNKLGGTEFMEDDERSLIALADRVATTLELARLREIDARAFTWFRAVVEQMPEAVVVVSDALDGGRYCNAAAKRLFGIKEEAAAVEAQTAAGVTVHVDDMPHRRASRGEIVEGLELSIRRPDGALVPVLVSAAPVLDGRPRSAVAVYRDISVAKQLEREREEWTGVVAHDLRQPAAVISFSAQLLARRAEALPQQMAKPIQRVCNAAKILSRMIDDLLQVSLIDARRLELKCSFVDVAALLREVVDRCKPMYGSHEVKLETTEARTVADPARIEQVVTNFLSNAVKYSTPDSPIYVRVGRVAGEIDVAVENFGAGLSARDSERIFQRFYRTPTARAGTVGGIGLGLYICKGIVEAHGGRIGVTSVRDRTTTFWFRLPERSESRHVPC